ncbi:hypothetical protein D3C77_107830 [compost metagenome]|uniref:hypothetical protein n=1 Tax=Pseudomonas TaxID=286 RepID=UPI0003F5A2BB|nr:MULTISPECIES: hypothetical protein [Pseudomonas]MCW2271208.1 hypothetical protein [Pseudomonas sp. JUb96]PRA58150.1 DUF4440 domain-containing protein [Pseudomonas sp. MYb187]
MPTDPVCFAAVIDLHVLIQQWLAGAAQSDQLPALMAHFSPSFSMIGLSGLQLDHAGLHALFTQAYGKRPGLEIGIDELQLIAQADGLTVVHYREHQHDARVLHSVRRSTAVFEQLKNGSLRWLRLHETPCP